MAGLTLASLGIPQSIGYANLARLDPQYGLYTSVVPPIVYSAWGTSRELAIGPVAVVSLLLSSMIQNVVDPTVDHHTYLKMVFTATFLTGIFQTSFGLCRLGFLVDFLSHAAIVGFMGGAAIVIGLQQLKGLLGLSHFTSKTDLINVIKAVLGATHEPWHSADFLIGSAFLIFILIARFIGKRHKKLFWFSAIAPLLSVMLSTFLVFITKADRHGVKIIQNVHGGLNPSSVKYIHLKGEHAIECTRIAIVCAIIALTEAIAVGRSFASINGYRLDGNKEMMALGIMNVAGSMTSCYVATGSFSRTAVNFSAGCKSVVSNIVMALTVIVALEFLMKSLYYMPVSVLSSIILSALPGLIDVREAYNIWRIDKMDFLACIGAFLGVLFGSVEIGLSVALIISFGKIIICSIRPHVEVLGQLRGSTFFGSTRQYPHACQILGVLPVRIDSSFLCFVNASFIMDKIVSLVIEENDTAKENAAEKIQSVIIDMSNVANIDTSGIAAVRELQKELGSLYIQLAIANPSWRTMHKMKVAKLVHEIGEDRIFLTVSEAVEACLSTKENV